MRTLKTTTIVSSSTDRTVAKVGTRRAIVNGEALASHIATHGDKVLDDCPACKSIQDRMNTQ